MKLELQIDVNLSQREVDYLAGKLVGEAKELLFGTMSIRDSELILTAKVDGQDWLTGYEPENKES